MTHLPNVSLSIVITAYNEGDEVVSTVQSVAANTSGSYEILIVDDGSTDGCCDHPFPDTVRVIRHTHRVGIAYSRNEASGLTTGDAIAYLDAHQRVSPNCLNECATLALRHNAIIWPEVRGLVDRNWTGHGAFFRLCKEHGYFNAKWNRRRPRDKLSRISTLIVPGYVMPRAVYEKVFWIRQLRGWGASEPAITLKAFFQDIDLLHVCGPMARHYFRAGRQIPYSASWESVWRNHALVARICFDDKTWSEHWLPNVFDKHLTSAVRQELESPEVAAEHAEFMARKVRPDREFWRGLLRIEEPPCLRR